MCYVSSPCFVTAARWFPGATRAACAYFPGSHDDEPADTASARRKSGSNGIKSTQGEAPSSCVHVLPCIDRRRRNLLNGGSLAPFKTGFGFCVAGGGVRSARAARTGEGKTYVVGSSLVHLNFFSGFS
jgi:hypothetical protein